MPILKIKDENGKVYEILALRGPQGLKGEDAYAKVVEYGYEGTEEEFYLAMSKNGKAPDKTLTRFGEAADAGVVGEEIQMARSYAEEVACDAAMGRAEAEWFEVQVETGNWTGEGDLWYQDIESDVGGIRAGDIIFPGLVLGTDPVENMECVKEYGKLLHIQAHNDAVTVWAKEPLGIDLTLRLQVIRG